MERLIITGGNNLRGTVRISGAKNSVLAVVCASLMAHEDVILDNVPNIRDVHVLLELVESLGVKIIWENHNQLRIMADDSICYEASHEKANQIRASNLLLGSLLARCGKAKISLPGGCNIGTRPMDLHFKGLRALGARIDIEQGFIVAACSDLQGNDIYLDFPSVGATENIMMLACLAKGQTTIGNAAREPEVVDLANFLNTLGAKVKGAGTDLIKIDGVEELHGGRHVIIPDRIEAGTFMVAAAASHGDVILENVIQRHLEPLIAKLREAAVEVITDNDTIRVRHVREMIPINIKTMPYPGFPTDMQSQFISMLATVKGTSTIVENVFEKRFQIADELNRMGAKIKIEGRVAIVEGVDCLEGTHVKATDLRAGVSLVIAALMAEGKTEISNVSFIDRGYDNLESKLLSLGADIVRINVPY